MTKSEGKNVLHAVERVAVLVAIPLVSVSLVLVKESFLKEVLILQPVLFMQTNCVMPVGVKDIVLLVPAAGYAVSAVAQVTYLMVMVAGAMTQVVDITEAVIPPVAVLEASANIV